MSGTTLAAPVLAFSRRRRPLRLISRHLTIFVGGLLLTLLIAAAVGAPLITPFDPIALDVAHRLRPPDAVHWFGTDNYGRDILSRTLYGGPLSPFVRISPPLRRRPLRTLICPA